MGLTVPEGCRFDARIIARIYSVIRIYAVFVLLSLCFFDLDHNSTVPHFLGIGRSQEKGKRKETSYFGYFIRLRKSRVSNGRRFTTSTTLTPCNPRVIFPLVTVNRFHRLLSYSLKRCSYDTIERSKKHGATLARSAAGSRKGECCLSAQK